MGRGVPEPVVKQLGDAIALSPTPDAGHMPTHPGEGLDSAGHLWVLSPLCPYSTFAQPVLPKWPAGLMLTLLPAAHVLTDCLWSCLFGK